METIADFEVQYSQFLDPEGKPSSDIPELANDTEKLIDMYRLMTETRVFDTKAVNLQRTGKLGTYASCLGHEATHQQADQRHVLVDRGEHAVVEAGARLQVVEQALEVARERGAQAQQHALRIAVVRALAEQPGIAPQVLELQIQLRRVVLVGVEREGLRKDAPEAVSPVALEAHLAGVEGVREAPGRGEPLAAGFKPRERGGTRAGDLGAGAQRTRSRRFSPDS